MTKSVFVKFVSEPKNDKMKSIVGLACAAQAVNDGHDVSVFFAAAGTRLLDPDYLAELGQEIPMVSDFMDTLISLGPHSTSRSPPSKQSSVTVKAMVR